MLFREHDGHRFVITQPVHAWVSGQIARAWGNEQFGDVAPRNEVCLGAELHDIGWLAWELEPTFNPQTGLPHTFMQLSTTTHLSIWGQASRSARPFGRYASMLVSMHGTGLYAFHDYARDTDDEARSARAFVERELAYQKQVLEEIESDVSTAMCASSEAVARNRRLISVWDAMSLAICSGLRSTRVLRDVPSAAEPVEIAMNPAGHGVSVDPWPFSQSSVTVRFEARALDVSFSSEAEMRDALSSASWSTFEVPLVRG
jgi:hypothetical protein